MERFMVSLLWKRDLSMLLVDSVLNLCEESIAKGKLIADRVQYLFFTGTPLVLKTAAGGNFDRLQCEAGEITTSTSARLPHLKGSLCHFWFILYGIFTYSYAAFGLSTLCIGIGCCKFASVEAVCLSCGDGS